MSAKRNAKIKVGITLVLFAIAVVGSMPASAQTTAAITGRVTDASGGIVPGAKITVRDVERGTVWPAETNSDGIYDLPRLPIGTYEIKVEKQGFKAATRSSIALEVNQVARLD